MSFWSDVVHYVSEYYTSAWAAATGGAVKNASGDVASASKAIAGPAGIATIFEAIWSQLTNAKTWKSLGWLLLGVMLMLIGLYLWLGPVTGRMSPAGMAGRAAS